MRAGTRRIEGALPSPVWAPRRRAPGAPALQCTSLPSHLPMTTMSPPAAILQPAGTSPSTTTLPAWRVSPAGRGARMYTASGAVSAGAAAACSRHAGPRVKVFKLMPCAARSSDDGSLARTCRRWRRRHLRCCSWCPAPRNTAAPAPRAPRSLPRPRRRTRSPHCAVAVTVHGAARDWGRRSAISDKRAPNGQPPGVGSPATALLRSALCLHLRLHSMGASIALPGTRSGFVGANAS